MSLGQEEGGDLTGFIMEDSARSLASWCSWNPIRFSLETATYLSRPYPVAVKYGLHGDWQDDGVLLHAAVQLPLFFSFSKLHTHTHTHFLALFFSFLYLQTGLTLWTHNELWQKQLHIIFSGHDERVLTQSGQVQVMNNISDYREPAWLPMRKTTQFQLCLTSRTWV